MADGSGEESLEGDSKKEEEVELDLTKCAKEFAQYCQVDVINESKAIEGTIEEMLVRLDEFSHLADTIRNDSSQSLIELMPQLHARSQELPTIFRRIDQLEAFVNVVKKNVDEVEESVVTAERELGSHTIQRVLSSIPGLRQMKQSPPKKDKNLSEWKPPVIFKTSDFFGPPSTKEQSTDNTHDPEKDTTVAVSANEQSQDSKVQLTDN